MNEFRQDLQLVRGLAVLAVTVYHLRTAWLPAGFLGVDVFFVLSGFLMASLYRPDSWRAVGDYLLRRARRILPAYFVVITVTVFAAACIVLPHELATVVAHAYSASALLPNVGFWLDDSYFSNLQFKPLLHLWSLGVELQFYLLFPLAAWLLRRSVVALTIVSALSFAACLAVLAVSPKTAFFMTPLRLWEFGLGMVAAACAPGLVRGLGSARANLAGACALLALLPCFALHVPESAHPGWAALVVSCATALVLAGGLPATWTARAPGRALAGLGTYSYSVYLVHFPLIALASYRPFASADSRRLDGAHCAFLVLAIAVTSYALYHLVETPARRLRATTRYATVQLALAFLAVAVGVIAVPAQRSAYSPAALRILDAWFDRDVYRCGKLARIVHPGAASCTLVAVPIGAERYLLVGDSHADALKSALGDAARAAGAGLDLLAENCALGRGDACQVEAVIARAQALGARHLVLHAATGGEDLAALPALFARATQAGLRVHYIEPTPDWPVHVPQALYVALVDDEPTALPAQDLAAHRARNAVLRAVLASASPAVVTRFEPAAVLCTPRCRVSDDDGRPLYFDEGHLTLTGARTLAPLLARVFAVQS